MMAVKFNTLYPAKSNLQERASKRRRAGGIGASLGQLHHHLASSRAALLALSTAEAELGAAALGWHIAEVVRIF